MADAPAPSSSATNPQVPKPKAGSLWTFVGLGLILFLILPQGQAFRVKLGNWVGVVLDPAIGFDGKYPVLTIVIAGTIMVLATTLIRHFTTDWLEQARVQAYMRSFQKELTDARKTNNTYKMKKLQDKQPEVLAKQQDLQAASMRTMPFTMVIVIPLFAWLFQFLASLDYWWYSAPWNPRVNMFETTVFPHYILLYMTLSIPLGALVQKAMKYASWKERWQRRHPEVHEG